MAKVHESAENYLETLLILTQKFSRVRSIDVVNRTGYSKPTVSIAMKRLRGDGYIAVDDDGYITLERKGLEIAERMYERHQVIAQILMSLGVDEETAYADSCRIEHSISAKSFQCMKDFFSDRCSDGPLRKGAAKP